MGVHFGDRAHNVNLEGDEIEASDFSLPCRSYVGMLDPECRNVNLRPVSWQNINAKIYFERYIIFISDILGFLSDTRARMNNQFASSTHSLKGYLYTLR